MLLLLLRGQVVEVNAAQVPQTVSIETVVVSLQLNRGKKVCWFVLTEQVVSISIINLKMYFAVADS